jgi:two-component system phosphate regulon sensor histidine kinase PhoR
MMYLAVAYPGTTDQPLQGFIRVSVDERNVMLANTRLRQFVWIFTLSLGALAAVAMWSFAAREMEPLRSFSIAARRIAEGQFDSVPAVLDRNDEWRSLSDAFRNMQNELATRENRLVENSQRLEAVLCSMIEGVIAIDSVGTVMLANQAACKMLGIDQTDLIGRKLLGLVRIPPLQQAIEQTQLKRVFSMVEFQTFDQPRKTISARVSVLADGPQSGVAIVLHDITELRQLESIRSDFVANVSHELKTPLASIKAFAETLRLGAINDQANNMQFVEQIETHADLLNEQIMDLLQLAKVESGQALLDIVDVPLQEICEDAIGLHTTEARDRKVSLKFDGCDPDVIARADRDALMSIIENLITNAIRYTPAGGHVYVSASREANLAVIQVTDTGIGIAPEHQSRIFERFYRVDRARSRDLGGTGLGLSIVKHLTQALGGGVHVESRIGKGSTFRIKLPGPKNVFE